MHLFSEVFLPYSSMDSSISIKYKYCPVGWSCRINRLYLCNTPLNECPGYDTRQSDGEASVILKLWEMQRTPLLPSLPGLLWPRVVAPDRVLSMCQIELNCVLMLNWITWNRTVLIFNYMWTKTILILNWIGWIRTVCIKMDLVLNNLQRLICHKPKQPTKYK